MRRALLAVVVVVILAGCAAPVTPDEQDRELEDGIGVVDGVAYDDELSIAVEDGLNETELDLLATRSMARIEVIRELEFDRTVEIELLSREEFREQRSGTNASEEAVRFENTVWEALFVVGDDRDVTQVFDETMGDAVQGFYSPSEERVVVVTDDTADLSKQTLVHELVHALQDQRFGLDAPPPRQDPAMARNGVVEGEGELIPELYFERCEREWSCLEPPTATQQQTEIDPGIILVLIQPYQDGPAFVEAIRDRGGWEAVNGLYDAYPESTAQVIEPEKYPDTGPVNVTVADRSGSAWSPIEHDPPAETVGQAALHVMLRQSGVVSADSSSDYHDPISAGWAGDELVPYERDDGETGYVWELAFESDGAAEQFRDAYRDVLAEDGARERGQRSFVIDDGPFEGAYDVRLDGDTVTVVNAPSVEALSDVHAE